MIVFTPRPVRMTFCNGCGEHREVVERDSCVFGDEWAWFSYYCGCTVRRVTCKGSCARTLNFWNDDDAAFAAIARRDANGGNCKTCRTDPPSNPGQSA